MREEIEEILADVEGRMFDLLEIRGSLTPYFDLKRIQRWVRESAKKYWTDRDVVEHRQDVLNRLTLQARATNNPLQKEMIWRAISDLGMASDKEIKNW